METTQGHHKALQQEVKNAQHITGTPLRAIKDIQKKCCTRQAHCILKDFSHPANTLFIFYPLVSDSEASRPKPADQGKALFPQLSPYRTLSPIEFPCPCSPQHTPVVNCLQQRMGGDTGGSISSSRDEQLVLLEKIDLECGGRSSGTWRRERASDLVVLWLRCGPDL